MEVRGIPARRPTFTLDIIVALLAVVAARTSAGLSDADPTPAGWAIAFYVLLVANLTAVRANQPRFVLSFLDDARAIIGSAAIATMTVSFVRLLVSADPNIASQAARLWLFAATYLIAARAAYHLSRARARRLGVGGRNTLIVGAGEVGQFVAARLRDRPEFGLRPIAFLDHDPLPLSSELDLPVLGQGEDPAALADRLAREAGPYDLDHVIISFSRLDHNVEGALIRRCQELDIPVSLVPRLFEGVPDHTSLERIGGLPLVSLNAVDPRGFAFRVKYTVDRLVATVAIVLLSPVLALAALGTRLTLGRPILFRQERVGLDGREFPMLKFRTMHGTPDERGEADADWAARELGEREEGEAQPASAQHTSRFGSVLRATSIDELPQLFNVAKGEMSLVGPRPERRSYVELFERSIRRYDDRHRVKSGITGWAQVQGLRGRTSLKDRVEWDNYYIENWSLWLDLKILMLTPIAALREFFRPNPDSETPE